MEQLNETSRKFAYPKLTQVGDDLVLTTRDYFVIITSDELEKIKRLVIGEGKTIYIHKETMLVYMNDNYVIFEKLRDVNNFRRILMVSASKL